MAIDGYVLDCKTREYDRPLGFTKTNRIFAVKSKVKPRTKDKDPLTKLPHYGVWILLIDSDVKSAYIYPRHIYSSPFCISALI